MIGSLQGKGRPVRGGLNLIILKYARYYCARTAYAAARSGLDAGLRRRRNAPPTKPIPSNIIAHVPGSGTAAAVASEIEAPLAACQVVSRKSNVNSPFVSVTSEAPNPLIDDPRMDAPVNALEMFDNEIIV